MSDHAAALAIPLLPSTLGKFQSQFQKGQPPRPDSTQLRPLAVCLPHKEWPTPCSVLEADGNTMLPYDWKPSSAHAKISGVWMAYSQWKALSWTPRARVRVVCQSVSEQVSK
jgi:hypothetical protein